MLLNNINEKLSVALLEAFERKFFLKILHFGPKLTFSQSGRIRSEGFRIISRSPGGLRGATQAPQIREISLIRAETSQREFFFRKLPTSTRSCLFLSLAGFGPKTFGLVTGLFGAFDWAPRHHRSERSAPSDQKPVRETPA